MTRMRTLALLVVFAAGLSGCNEDDTAGVGPGPGPARVEKKDDASQTANADTPRRRPSSFCRTTARPPPRRAATDGCRAGPSSTTAGTAPGRGRRAACWLTTVLARPIKARATSSRPARAGFAGAGRPGPRNPAGGRLAQGRPQRRRRGRRSRASGLRRFPAPDVRRVRGRLQPQGLGRGPRQQRVHPAPSQPRDGAPYRWSSAHEAQRLHRGSPRNPDLHMGPERGWADIGYHFVIDGSGRVFEGRHADVLGAHAGGANWTTSASRSWATTTATSSAKGRRPR